MIPLMTATDGMLNPVNCFTLGSATFGMLSCPVDEIIEEAVEKAIRSGSKKRSPYKIVYKEKEFKITDDLLYLQDDDIMIIIKVFLECQ